MTFSDFCSREEHGICHIVEHGENDRVWWFGFDCCHSGDFSPGLTFTLFPNDTSYRDLNYVKEQCRNLAKQLIEVNKKKNEKNKKKNEI